MSGLFIAPPKNARSDCGMPQHAYRIGDSRGRVKSNAGEWIRTTNTSALNRVPRTIGLRLLKTPAGIEPASPDLQSSAWTNSATASHKHSNRLVYRYTTLYNLDFRKAVTYNLSMKCPICKKPTKRKFCSSSCAATFNNKRFPKRARTKKCKMCGVLILARNTYCSDCWGSKKNRTHKVCPQCRDPLPIDAFHSTGGRYPRPLRRCKRCHRQWRKEIHATFKKRCIDYKGGKCEICGYARCARSLVFHHRTGKKDFQISGIWPTEKLTRKIIKELDKCKLLCANCHGEAHDRLNNGE